MIDLFLEMIILAYGTGCFTFELIMYNEAHPATITQFALSVIYFIAPI